MEEQRFHAPIITHTTGNEGIVDFLRREADQAEASAKRLRELANALDGGTMLAEICSPLAGISYESAPLDENGIPKYKGRKRGRKPKKRLRKRNPNAKKRSHTAYTLFVQETYPKIKEQHGIAHTNGDPNQVQSKNIISLVAKQWQEVPPNEKEEWKRRAKEFSEQMDDGDGPVESEEEGDDHQVHGHGHGHEHAHNILAVHHQTAVDAVDHLTSNHGGSAGVHEHQHQHGVAHEMNEHENLQG